MQLNPSLISFEGFGIGKYKKKQEFLKTNGLGSGSEKYKLNLHKFKFILKKPLGSLSINSSSFAAICGIIADHALVCWAW